MCGGQASPFDMSKPQAGQYKPMDAGQGQMNSPFTFYTPPQSPMMGQRPQQGFGSDMGSAGGNMAWGGGGWTPPDYGYRQMDPTPLPQGRSGHGAPGWDWSNAGMNGGNMSPGGAQPTYTGFPPQAITNPMDQGQTGGNMYQPPQQPGLQPYQAGYQPPQTGQSWDPPPWPGQQPGQQQPGMPLRPWGY